MNTILEVTKRDAAGEGTIPAVVYGPKQESLSIAVDKILFDKVFKAAGESTIITLVGLEEEIEVLVHDLAFNPTRGGVEHVDFYAIERGKELTTNVTISFVGEAPVEKGGATVVKAAQEVMVTCRPSVLPSEFEVDLSVLTDVSVSVTVADLVVPEGVTIDTDPETVLVTVSGARVEESEDAAEAVDMDAVAVEQKGKGEAAEGAEDKPSE